MVGDLEYMGVGSKIGNMKGEWRREGRGNVGMSSQWLKVLLLFINTVFCLDTC